MRVSKFDANFTFYGITAKYFPISWLFTWQPTMRMELKMSDVVSDDTPAGKVENELKHN